MNTKKVNYYLVAALVIVLILCVILIHVSHCNALEYYPKALVDVHEDSYLVVREGPGLQYDKTHLNLANRAILSILNVQDGWALVQFPKMVGVREPMGWVCMDYLNYDKEIYEIWENLEK